jgi:hypothetical protein
VLAFARGFSLVAGVDAERLMATAEAVRRVRM